MIGINVGTYVQSKVEMQEGEVVRRFKSETVANTGVSAAAFAAKLEAFRRAQHPEHCRSRSASCRRR